MLGENPGAVQKRIGQFHSQQTGCAFIHLGETFKETQVGHRHNNGGKMMTDNRDIQKMLAVRSSQKVNAHGHC